MNWHNAQDLRERIDALEDVIRELTDAEKYGVPGGYRDRGFDWPYRDWCTYCLRSWAREEQEQHDDDCPILRARALLERIARNEEEKNGQNPGF